MKPIWHVYYLTRGSAGGYINTLLKVSKEEGLPVRGFVSSRYRFRTPSVTRCFFPLTDRSERRNAVIKAIRGMELLAGYLFVLIGATIRRPIINVHLVDDLWATALFIRMLTAIGLRVAVSCHDVVPQYTGMSARRRSIYRRVSRLIVHSAAAQRMLRDQLENRDARKVAIYPFPTWRHDQIVSERRLKEAGDEIDRLVGRGTPYVLFVGVVHLNKGIDLLLDAWAQIDSRGARLVVAGKWVGVPAEIRRQAEHDDTCVVIDRFVSDELFVSLIQRADLIVLPYREYAHSGILHCCEDGGGAVVVSDIELFAEQLPSYDLMFAAGNTQDLVRTLRSALSLSEGERRQRGNVLRESLARNGQTLGAALKAVYTSELPAPSSNAGPVSRTKLRRPTDPLSARLYQKSPTLLQNSALSVAGWRQKRVRHGATFWRELELLEESEFYSADQLRILQEERLQQLVATAYNNVPHYREVFDRTGLKPADIKTADDLQKLPVLHKATVIAAGGSMVNQSVPVSDRITGHTSGSTGTAIPLVYDRAALAAEFATVWRLRRRFGCDLDRWHATFAGRLVVPHKQSRPPYHRVNYAQKQMLFSLYHLKPETVSAYADALASRSLQFYFGYPSALQALALAGARAGIEIRGPEKALFPSSESLLAWQRKQLERDFGVPVYDRYGCAEFCVSFTVCPEGRYHLDSEFAIVELEKLSEDDSSITGELICTGLTNHAMPFIRYRVGDVATVAKTPCPCGRASLSAFEIDGRAEDFVLTKSGVRLGRLDHLFKDMHSIRESQIVQEEQGRMTIKIVRAPEYGASDEQQLLAECSSRMGDDMDVELAYATEIPRNAAGKFRAVVNKIEDAQRYTN